MVSIYIFVFFLTATVGLLVLVHFEKKENFRVFSQLRSRVDSLVGNSEKVINSIDFAELIEKSASYVAYQASHGLVAILHLLAHKSEKVLGRARRRIQDSKPKIENPSNYVKTIQEFKNGLNGK